MAAGGARERLAHASLVNTSVYCYSIFYDSGGGWKGPRTNSGRPFDTSGNVKWAFSSGLFSTTPPTVGGAGVIATNNDNVVHAMERGALGGEWPAGWRPALLGGAVQGRSPVVPIPVGGANPVVFLGAQDGGVYAVNGATGGAGPAPWAAPTAIGGIVQAAPGGMFTAFGGARDALFVGTRDAGADNALVALDPDGTEIDRFDNGGGANSIGVISGAATVDYARKRVYFASDTGGSANTLWCLEIDDVLANPVFKQLLWARPLGRITSSPVVRGDRVYVANDLGTLYSIHESGAARARPHPGDRDRRGEGLRLPGPLLAGRLLLDERPGEGGDRRSRVHRAEVQLRGRRPGALAGALRGGARPGLLRRQRREAVRARRRDLRRPEVGRARGRRGDRRERRPSTS